MLTDRLCKKYGGNNGSNRLLIQNMVVNFMDSTAEVTEQKLNRLEMKVANAVGSAASQRIPKLQSAGNSITGAPLSARERNQIIHSARRELRSSQGGRPSSRLGTPKGMASSNSLKNLGFKVANPGATSSEGEWLVLAYHNKLQYEKEQKDYHQKIKNDRVVNKKYLDEQQKALEKSQRMEVEEDRAYARVQDEELRQHKLDEDVKMQKRMAKILAEKKFRDEQIQDIKRNKEVADEQTRKEDARTIARVQQAMEAEKEQARLAKVRERQKMDAILRENEKNQQSHLRTMEEEAKEDVMLMRQYAEKLKKQDIDRAEQFAKTQHKLESNTAEGAKIKAKEEAQAARLDAMILKFSKEKDAKDAAREEFDKKKKLQDEWDKKRTLDVQMSEMRRAEQEEMALERAYADAQRREVEEAFAKEKAKQATIKRQNREYQKLLRQQMGERVNGLRVEAPFNTLDKSVDLGGMSQAEQGLNKKLLENIVKNSEAKSAIEDMLNQGGMGTGRSGYNQLSNVF
jgi:hypothetical protein